MEYKEYNFEIYNPDYYMGDVLPITALTDEMAMLHARSLTFLLLENTVISVTQGYGPAKRLVGNITNKQVLKECDEERRNKELKTA